MTLNAISEYLHYYMFIISTPPIFIIKKKKSISNSAELELAHTGSQKRNLLRISCQLQVRRHHVGEPGISHSRTASTMDIGVATNHGFSLLGELNWLLNICQRALTPN